jgi:hypothetical protein
MTLRARLPLIPLSPLIQTSCGYAEELAQITQFLSENNTPETTALLEKRVVKEREKLDRLTKNMQAIQSSFITDFNIYDIAKEIAYINCSLFRMVTLDKDWLCNFDKQSNMIPLLDFHRYLSHSFAHQVIVAENAAKNIVAQLILLAYTLLHVYRDFSGCSAILTSLQMPQVQRQQSKWSVCPTNLINVYKELVLMLSPQNNYEAYHHQLWLNTSRFLNVTPNKSQMIAVPFMNAHLLIIRNLVQTHSSSSCSETETVVVLSEAGQKVLTSAVRLLQFCQQYLKVDPMELEKYASTSHSLTSQRRLSLQSSNTRYSSGTNSLKLPMPVCLDLDQLRGNMNIYHWLVSRAYLSCSQLHCEGLCIEPQAIGEAIVEAEEEYDLYWDFFSQEDPKNQDPLVVTAMNEQTAVDDLVIVTRMDLGVEDQVPNNSKATGSKNENELSMTAQGSSNSALHDVQNKNINSKAIIPVKVSCNDVEIVSGNEADTDTVANIGKIDINQDRSRENHTLNAAATIANEQDRSRENDTTTNTTHKEQPLLIENNQGSSDQETIDQTKHQEEVIVVQSSALDENTAASEDTLVLVPILSPTAPEFIPQTQSSTTTTNTTASEIDYMDNEDEDEDDDVIILTEEDEDDEEWTGYPIKSSQTADTEEDENEEWTGYPFTSQDEEDDDDEVWKGYPVPQEEQQGEGNITASAPLIPQEEEQQMMGDEEWKGYQKTSEEEERRAAKTWNNKNNQSQAIGKAAARRMQYSLSNTDANRKRLPSQFVPSTST